MEEQIEHVPVWTIATDDVAAPDVSNSEDLTPERLAELRTGLATFAKAPIATLEMHPIERRRSPYDGIALHASSPLALSLIHI